jgi:pyruvate dehydrogenase E1 component alpha subunit
MTVAELIQWENRVVDSFSKKEIKAPVHLYSGNEQQMIDIFEKIQPQDWVFCTWRSHYQCLLKGVPQDRLLNDIKDGKSISLCYPEYKVFSSAIVTGNIPIANGVALSIKRSGILNQHVYCFTGDMTAETGCFYENWKYSILHDLPITWVVEDNGKSVCTDTKKTWNLKWSTWDDPNSERPYNIIYYKYQTKYPHAGTGERIQF